MKDFGYLFAKIKYRLHHNKKEIMSDYFRQAGMRVGTGCNICCNIMTTEPYLIEIGNNVTISGNVVFVTHDNSIAKFYGNGNDLFGRIVIGDNSFIGQGSIIMYGVTIPPNTIIGAGSVVTMSPKEEGCIIAGVPARSIRPVDSFAEKVKNNVINTNGLSASERKTKVLSNQDSLIVKGYIK